MPQSTRGKQGGSQLPEAIQKQTGFFRIRTVTMTALHDFELSHVRNFSKLLMEDHPISSQNQFQSEEVCCEISHGEEGLASLSKV